MNPRVFVRVALLSLSTLAACQSSASNSPTQPAAPEMTVTTEQTAEGADEEGSDAESSEPPTEQEAALDEVAGDESLDGLIGTWRIEGHIPGAVSALSNAEIADLTGKEIVITPSGLTTPWLSCKSVQWSHASQPLEEWLTSWKAPALSAQHEKLLGNDGDAPVLIWTGPCGETEVTVAQTTERVAILHDGVLLVARRES